MVHLSTDPGTRTKGCEWSDGEEQYVPALASLIGNVFVCLHIRMCVCVWAQAAGWQRENTFVCWWTSELCNCLAEVRKAFSHCLSSSTVTFKPGCAWRREEKENWCRYYFLMFLSSFPREHSFHCNLSISICSQTLPDGCLHVRASRHSSHMKSSEVGQYVDLYTHTASWCIWMCVGLIWRLLRMNIYAGQPLSPTGLDLQWPEPSLCAFRLCVSAP